MAETEPSIPSSTASATAVAAPAGSHGLDALKKMSTTAGLGSGDYEAVSPLAVAAVVSAFLGLTAFFNEILLVFSAAGLVLGVMGLIQIRRSEHTLTGRVFALAGLLLGLAMLAVVGGGRALGEVKLKPERQHITDVIQSFGKLVSAHDYDAAYALCDPAFQKKVSPADFKGLLELHETRGFGKLTATDTTGQVIFINADGSMGSTGDVKRAVSGATFTFAGRPDPVRGEVQLVKNGDKWIIFDLPTLFADRNAQQQ